MSDILKKRAAMQTSSTRDVNRYGVSSSLPSTPVHRELDLITDDSRRSMSTLASDTGTFHTARTFEVATEKGGRRVMSEEEVNSLVHNALRRARQATNSVSPRHQIRPNPLSPRMTTSSAITSPRPPASPLKTPGIILPGEGELNSGSSFPRPRANRGASQFSSSDSGEAFVLTTMIESNVSNISYDGSELFHQAHSDEELSMSNSEDSVSVHPGLETVNSSEAIIRRVEEEIANARKAAQEANLRLAGVTANLRLNGVNTKSYDLRDDPSDEFNLPAKPQPSDGSSGPPEVRNDADLVDSRYDGSAIDDTGEYRSYNSFSSAQETNSSADMASSPSLDNQVSVMTEESVDHAKALLDEVLNGPSLSSAGSDLSDEGKKESTNNNKNDVVNAEAQNENDMLQVELLHLESESIDKERYVVSPTSYGRTDEDDSEQISHVAHQSTPEEQMADDNHTNKTPAPARSHSEFQSQLTAQGNIIMRILAEADEKPRSEPMEETTYYKFVDGEGSCHEVIDLTAVGSEGTSGPAKALTDEPQLVGAADAAIHCNASVEFSTTPIEYEAPEVETRNITESEQEFRLKYPTLAIEPRGYLTACDDISAPFEDTVEENETAEQGPHDNGISAALEDSIEENETIGVSAEHAASNSMASYGDGTAVQYEGSFGENEIVRVSAEHVTSISVETYDTGTAVTFENITKENESIGVSDEYCIQASVASYDDGTSVAFQDSIEEKESVDSSVEHGTSGYVANYGDGASAPSEDSIKETESIAVSAQNGNSGSFEDCIEHEGRTEVVAEDDNSRVLQNSIQKTDNIDPPAHSPRTEKEESLDFKLKYPVLDVELKRETMDCSRGTSISSPDSVEEKESEDGIKATDEKEPHSIDHSDPSFSDSAESDGQQMIESSGKISYDEPIELSIQDYRFRDLEVASSRSVKRDTTDAVTCDEDYDDEGRSAVGGESAATAVIDEHNAISSTSVEVQAILSSQSSAKLESHAAFVPSPDKEIVSVPVQNSINDTEGAVMKVEEPESLEARSNEESGDNEMHKSDTPALAERSKEEVEETNSDDGTQVIANNSLQVVSDEETEESAGSEVSYHEMVETVAVGNIEDQGEHVFPGEDVSANEQNSSKLDLKPEPADDLMAKEESKKGAEVQNEQPPAHAPIYPSAVKTSRSNRVRFKQRYPVPPSTKKPRSAENIVMDHRVAHSEIAVFLSRPKPDLNELLEAAVGSSLHRRSNACGALKVLTTQKKNQLTLVRTAGFLDALVLAANTKISGQDIDSAKDARLRAVVAICNVCEPKDNREIVFKHPGLASALIKTMMEDKAEARTAACGGIAMLAKTPSNREPMAQTRNLIKSLAVILKGGRSTGGFNDEIKSSFSEDSLRESYSSGSESTTSSLQNDSSLSQDEGEAALPRVRSMREEKKSQSGETLKRGQLNACAALLHISKQCGATPLMSSNVDLMDALVEVSQREDDPKHTKCLEIICNMTRFPANNEPMAQYPGFIEAMVRNGGSTNDFDRVWTLRTLQNISTDATGKTFLANRIVLELLSYSVMRDNLEEQLAATATLYNLSTEPGAVVPLTNTKNVVATLVHVAHNPDSPSEVRLMACDALATLGLWMQTLAGAGTLPKDMDENVTLPSYITSGWERWD